jgi:DNA-binding protein HU-beta
MANKDIKLTLPELAATLAAELGVSKAKATDALRGLFAGVGKTVLAGGKVTIFGFGTFKLRETKAHKGVNPRKAGEKIDIAASKSVIFKCAPSLKVKSAAKAKKK